MKIIKLIWEWIDWKELYRWIREESHYAIGVSALIFACTLFLMLAIAEYEITQRLNHLELRMNSFDHSIPYMEIK